MIKKTLAAAVPLSLIIFPCSGQAQTFSVSAKSAINKPAAELNVLDIDQLPQKTWHHTAMPGEVVYFKSRPGIVLEIDGQPVSGNWTALPSAGTSRLRAYDAGGNVTAKVTLFTLQPSSAINAKGYLGKYRIGMYPRNTPKGFIKLEKNERELPVSEHFKVGQFLCKQQPGTWPKYLLVSHDNLIRLEALLEELNRTDNIEAETFFVMSGFRTPFYNSAIGSAKYSRHMYGDAADIYVDTKPRNGTMDDLNRDGRISKADANYMYDYAAKLFKDKKLKQGGIGAYKANAVHGPFIHVDARGRAARWGR